MDQVKKLEKKAVLIQFIKDLKADIIDIDSIDDFISIKPEKIILIDEKGKKVKSKLIKATSENAFYKKSSGEYYRFKAHNEKNIENLINWTFKFKEYIDDIIKNLFIEINKLKEDNKILNEEIIRLKNSLRIMDSSFKEGLEQINKLTDLKIKNIKKLKK